MPKTFFITTAIDYTNSPPHIGHAYEKVLADVVARYHRLKGEKVFFLTGVDQHGQKVQQSAAKAGVPPEKFVKGITQKFVDLWKKLDVKYDEWAETTDERHKRVVQKILQRLFEQGQIYKDKQGGYYSVRQEQFLTDRERGSDGEFGPEWGQVEFREEENYYFKLGQYKDWLLGYLKEHSACVTPSFRQTELINAVEKISGDLCISRPKSRLDWGIELPFDKNFVTYVWFDALTNYISFIGYEPAISTFNIQPSSFRDKWPALQIIGKDILIPAHGIYWMIMLKAVDFPDETMPRFLVHGWWNISGAKMSKSAGNIVDPSALVDKYGPDALRYYLMSDIATGQDADFNEERLVLRYNANLANSLGNLLNRTLNMAWKYRDGRIRKRSVEEWGEPLDLPEGAPLGIRIFDPAEAVPIETGSLNLGDLRNQFKDLAKSYHAMMASSGISAALYSVFGLVTFCNQAVDKDAPWALAKNKSERAQKQLDAVFYYLMDALRIIAILISPVLPRAAHGIFDQLNWKMEKELIGSEKRFRFEDAKWGELPNGHVVGKPVPLFPRIEISD
jgi:methionyl-tRNA synthetase